MLKGKCLTPVCGHSMWLIKSLKFKKKKKLKLKLKKITYIYVSYIYDLVTMYNKL